jgi:hypothetical protein
MKRLVDYRLVLGGRCVDLESSGATSRHSAVGSGSVDFSAWPANDHAAAND